MTGPMPSREMQFFAYVQGQELRSVGPGDLVDALGLTPIQERKLLSRLSRAGRIARVRRGFYLVPPRVPPGGAWSPSEALVLKTLIEDQGGQYQVCGPNAFYRYGWDDQVPNRVYAYNNRISGQRQVGRVTMTLMKVADERLGATDVVNTPDGIAVVYSSRARSLMDAVYDWSRFNSLPRAYQWIREDLVKDDALAAELVNTTVLYGNQATLRRIGRLLEQEDVQQSLLGKLEKALRPSSSPIAWIPSFPKRGTTDKKWGVVVNDES